MMLKSCILAIVLCGTVATFSLGGYKGSSKKFSMRTINDKVASGISRPMESGNPKPKGRQPDFPEQLKYMMNIEGKGEIELILKRDRSVHVPTSFSPGKSGKYESHKLNIEKIAFYTEVNGHGSFACELKESVNGEAECIITALLDIGDDNCYLSAGANTMDCSSKDNGPPMQFSKPMVDPSIKPVNRTGSRQRRDLFPDPGFRAAEIVYLPDAKFTDLFYRRHPGDTTAAEAEMDMFFILLTNEINVWYSTLPESSSFSLYIQMYTAAIAYPGYRMNFPWSEHNNDGTNLHYNQNLRDNLDFVINDSGFITAQKDFVLAITGFNLVDSTNGSPLVSVTYQSVMCADSTKKYALTEFTAYNLPRILAHELGHAFGALHDDDTSCPANTNIMSMNMFNPDSTTKDTYFKFSQCSVDAMIDHVFVQYPDCLTQNAFTEDDFKNQFCQGFAGSQTGYLDKQCERLTNVVGSTACDSVSEEACYKRNQIRCTDSTGNCGTQKLQYVWNGTPCGTTAGNICYKGNCTSPVVVCSTTTVAPTAAPTSVPTIAPPVTPGPTVTAAPPLGQTSTTITSTTTTVTTTPVPQACSCCGIKRNKRRKRCCSKGRKAEGSACYCCGAFRDILPPPGWTGNTY